MAVRTLLSAKSGVDGATLVAGAGGNTDFDSLIIANAAGTSTVRLNFPTTGARGARFNSANTTSGTNYGSEGISPSTDRIRLEIPYRHEAQPTGDANILYLGTGGTRGAVIQFGASGAIRVRNAANTNLGSSSTGVLPTANNNYVLLFFANRVTGVVKCQLWLRGASTPVAGADLSFTGASIGTAAWDVLRFGSKASTHAISYDNTYGDIIIDTDSTDIGSPSWLGPPVIDTSPTPSFYQFLDLSGTTATTGPVAYTASPSTGVVGTSSGIFLPASTTVDIDYVITATDTGLAPPNTATLDWTVDAVAGAAQARQRLRRYNGTILA